MKIRIGYVGVHIATYYALEQGQFSRATTGLAALSAELGFELVAHETRVMNAEDALSVARDLALEKRCHWI